MTAFANRRARLRPESRTLVLIGVLLGFEAVLYSTIAPLFLTTHTSSALPGLRSGCSLPPTPAGQIPGALLGGLIATRAGCGERPSSRC